ncbi:MAG: phosphatidate cytidylyltransferase [Treponema sp.]|jgi:phosphatidate cytidylyltransferase|nr:phosphatidate cytidylyltransferase [Treponema sp.]
MKKLPKIAERLLVFFIGVPLVLSIVLFLPQKNHLAINVMLLALSALGGIEFTGLLKRKNPHAALSTVEAALCGVAAPLAMTLIVSFGAPFALLPVPIVALAMWLIMSRTFVAEDALGAALDAMSAGFATLLYPGFFMAWAIAMMNLPNAGLIFLVFLLLTLLNDAAAWAFGMLFGKGNQGFIKASPNKSLAGFAGGLVASMLIGLGATLFAAPVFTSPLLSAPLAGILTGLATGAAACIGDLGESAMKRSANAKDSGALIPGRGGVLDCIDSVCFAAPVYYLMYRLLFV